jgi:uncharacterized phage-like protein YoqJ
MIVAGSGHRPNKLGGFSVPNPTYLYVCQQIQQRLKQLQPAKVISGFALGYDQWLANIAIKLGIPVIAAIPFQGQENAWPASSQRTYRSLLNKVSETFIVCQGSYAAWKLQRRNEWMVDHCDLLLACYDGTIGGTHNCIQYAKSINRSIVVINPKTSGP